VVTEENPVDISKFVFPEEVLSLANNSIFLRVDHKKNISAWEYCEYLLRSRTFFFLFMDGTFKNCLRQFAELCSMNLDVEAHPMKTTYIRFCLYFCLIKTYFKLC